MLKAAVIGAGYMGSAITFPLAENNIEVNLVGTWLDDHLIESSIKGMHPKLKKPLDSRVKLFYFPGLEDALKDAGIIFIGIASEGFVNVFKKVVDNLKAGNSYCFFKLTKGLVEYKGRILRATEAAYDIYNEKFSQKDFLWASVGGPVRAMDLAYKTPSASIYGISDEKIKTVLKNFLTDYYRIIPTEDLKGVEVCSTFKNIYAIAAGICDGLYRKEKEGLYHNIVAMLFNQAVTEISKIVELAGSNKNTAFTLAGMGDLHVTSVAGRNRRYGEEVGKGNDADLVFRQMQSEGEYGEGYMAIKLAIPWLESLNKDRDFLKQQLPLLNALNNIISEKADSSSEINKLVKNF